MKYYRNRTLAEYILNNEELMANASGIVTRKMIEEYEVAAASMLMELMANTRTKGYAMLRDAVVIVSAVGRMNCSITNVLYPSIGEFYETGQGNVERLIRYTIKTIFENNSEDELTGYFGKTLVSNGRRANGTFIYTGAEKLRLERMTKKW